MMAARALAIVMALASVGGADDGGIYLSLPFELGGTSRENGRVFYGVRPELLLTLDGNHGLAFGPYVDLSRSSADPSIAIGMNVTYLTAAAFKVVPSVGVYHRFADDDSNTADDSETGYIVGAFLGFRDTRDRGGLDMPIGIRAEVRADFSDHREVVIVAQVDVLALCLTALFKGYTPNMM